MDERTEPAPVSRQRSARARARRPCYFVDSERYFDRQGIYMYPDDAERFIFFSRAALETCRALDWQPDVIHCNEWHTALVPNWLKTVYRDDPFYRGHRDALHGAQPGVPGHLRLPRARDRRASPRLGFIAHPDVAPDLNDVVDLMARGILFADIINTVSETYAREILTPEYGQRLDPVLRDRRDRLFGILNGIDTELYDPATDPNIAAQFDANNLERAAAEQGRAAGGAASCPCAPTCPLIGVVSRLIDQKGFDLIAPSPIRCCRTCRCQLVVMGTGEMRYHDMLNALAGRATRAGRRPPDLQPAARAAHLCGQRHLPDAVALRAVRAQPDGRDALRRVPVVHATGGLADTVHDYDPVTGEGNGFSFERYDAMALYAALVRAAETYRHHDIWRQLMRRCMAADFSWRRSAQKYVDLYYRAWPRAAAPRTLRLSTLATTAGRRATASGPVDARGALRTERLYYRDAYSPQFDARVTGAPGQIGGKPAVALDRTAFYPTGGGQPNDTGVLSTGRRPCLGRRRADGRRLVWHVLGRRRSRRRPRSQARSTGTAASTTCSSTPGSTSSRRRSSQACDAETVAFHLGDKASTIDLDRGRSRRRPTLARPKPRPTQSSTPRCR